MSLLLWSLIQVYSVTDKLYSDQIKLINVAKILKDAKISNMSYSDLQLALQRLNMKSSIKAASSNISSLLTISFQLFQQILTVVYSRRKIPPDVSRLTADEHALRELLNDKSSTFYDLIHSAKLTWSGILLGTYYPYYICKNNSLIQDSSKTSFDADQNNARSDGTIDLEFYTNQYVFELEDIHSKLSSGYNKKLAFNRAELNSVKALWEKNVDQIRSIYNYYSKSICHRKIIFNKNRGVVGNIKSEVQSTFMMSLENLNSFLKDFGVLPVLIDINSLIRIFRSVKLWEWELADSLLSLHYNVSGGGHSNLDIGDDVLGFSSAHGNLCISFSGFIEFLTRLAVSNGEALGTTPKACVSTVLHFMDENDGKHNMLKQDRGSRSLNRKFIYK